MSLIGHLKFVWRVLKALPRLRGYDVVQLINPVFLEVSPWPLPFIYRYLRKSNKRVVLGAFGMDHYWVMVNREQRPMRYSDFNIGDKVRTDSVAQADVDTWIGTEAERLCRHVAMDSDAIVAGLYEYWVTYQLAEGGGLREKTTFIPFPVAMPEKVGEEERSAAGGALRIFVGISKGRSAYKGTDIMLEAARRLEASYPGRVELLVAEGVPFERYRSMMDGSDVILDQLYSYTPAMNALLAMSKGIICVGGGEPEHYALLQEDELRPIVNVLPDAESVYEGLEKLLVHPEMVGELKRQSMEYVRRHHDPMLVARQYEKLYIDVMRKAR